MNPFQKWLPLLLLFLLTSCFSKSSQNPLPQNLGTGVSTPRPAVVSQPEPWTLQLLSTCQNNQKDHCIAGRGFSIRNDETYFAGTQTGETTQSQRLKSEDFQALGELVRKEDWTRLASAPETCFALTREEAPQTDSLKDFITFHDGNREVPLIRASYSEFCVRHLTFRSARELFDQMRILAEKYNPVTIPTDPCEAAAFRLNRLYFMAQKCAQDTDCTFYQSDLTRVPRETHLVLAYNDCRPVKPLLLASVHLSEDLKESLFEEQSSAVMNCRTVVPALDCLDKEKHLSTQPAPVCRAGVCAMP